MLFWFDSRQIVIKGKKNVSCFLSSRKKKRKEKKGKKERKSSPPHLRSHVPNRAPLPHQPLFLQLLRHNQGTHGVGGEELDHCLGGDALQRTPEKGLKFGRHFRCELFLPSLSLPLSLPVSLPFLLASSRGTTEGGERYHM